MGHYVYVPTGGEPRLLILELDPASGGLTPKGEIELRAPGGAMCTDPDRRFLYVATREQSDTAVASYRIDPGSGGLAPIGEVDLDGCHPCYLAADRRGRFLLAAYYSDGLVTVHPIGSDGAACGPPADRRETERFAHWVATDRSNRYAFVPHVQSANAVYRFLFDEDSGRLTPNGRTAAGPGQGPRHMAFHPRLDVMYADNEQECSVTVYRLDPDSGKLQAVQTESTLPAGGFEGEKSNAQLHIHPDGRAVYASNRGPDSIAMFAVDPGSGRIASLGQQPAGEMPRSFGIDADGGYLLSGADRSNTLISFAIDGRGALEPAAEFDVGAPCAWVLPVKAG